MRLVKVLVASVCVWAVAAAAWPQTFYHPVIAAASVFFDPTGTGLASTTVQDALAELDTDVSAISVPVDSVFGRTGAVTATGGDYTASEVTNVAAGDIVATDVQAAIDELDTEKTAVADLAALTTGNGAALVGVEDSAANFAGTDVEAVLAELAASVGGAGGPVALVTFTVSGGTPTIQKQVNVSSITYNAAGDYTINFTSSLDDANYTASLSSRCAAGNVCVGIEQMDSPTRTVDALRVYSIRVDGVVVESGLYTAVIFD